MSACEGGGSGPNARIDELLGNVPVVDKCLANVVKKYAENAFNWHVVVRVAMDVLSRNGSTVRLGCLLNSLESCTCLLYTSPSPRDS